MAAKRKAERVDEHIADMRAAIEADVMAALSETTADEAIQIAKQLRLDQGRDKLMAFLERLK